MAIFRGVGGSGDSSDNSFLQEVTAQANAASASAFSAATSAAAILNLTADTGAAGTEASYDASTGVLTIPRGDAGVDAVVDTASVSAAGALMTTGGQLTGNITFSGTQTVDGRDLSVDGAKLDGIEANADVTDTANVTSAGALMDSEVTNLAQVKAFDSSDYATATQGTTADNALPKAGGQMTGNITFSGTETVDGRDVSVDGTKLDTLERVYRCRFSKGSPTLILHALSTTPMPLGDTYNTKETTGSENTLNLSMEMSHSDLYDTNDAYYNVNVYAGSNENVITLGTLTSVTTVGAYRQSYVSGDVTKHFSDFMGIARNSDGSSPINLNGFGWYYNVSENRTYIYAYLYQSNNFDTNETLYLHPFDWESSGTVIQSPVYDLDRTVYDGSVRSTHTKEHYLGYFKSSIDVALIGAEPSTNTDGNNVSINKISGSIVQIED